MAITYTPPSIAAESRSTLDVLQAGRKPDIRVDPAHLEENTVPLLRLITKLNKRVTDQEKFTWFEKQVFPYWTKAGAASLSGVLTVTVATGHGVFFQKGTLIWLPKSGTMCRVRSVSGDVVTWERPVAGTPDGDIALNDDIRIIGTAFAQGSDESRPKAVLETEVFNYTQIFKTGLGGSNTMAASAMYWGRDRPSQRKDRRVDHAIEIESAFLTGQRAQWTDPDTQESVSTTRGVINFITSNVTTLGAALTEPVMDQLISDSFRYHSSQGRASKWCFVGSIAEVQITGFAREKLRMRPKDKTFGINVSSYQAIGRELLLMRHNLLENNPISGATASNYMGGMMLIVDPGSPTYRHMRGRDTRLRKDIGGPGPDRWQDEYLTEAGLEFVNELWNSKVVSIV